MAVFVDETMLAVAADRLITDIMCVKPREQVVITADTATDPLAVKAVLNAARVHGARTIVCTVPQLPFQGSLADPHIPEGLEAVLTRCDVWFDMTFPYLGGSAPHHAAMEAKRARCLLLADLGAGGIARLYGNVDLDRLFEVQGLLDRLVENATGKECRVTCRNGTNMRFTIAKPATRKMRHTNEPGTYTPPGSAVIYPEPSSVRGEIVVRGVFHEYHTRLNEPLHITVEGQIREVRGGGNERSALERALMRSGGGKYGRIIHLSHGFHPAARFTGTSFIEDIRVRGNNAIGLGIPWWEPGGGENHPDAITVMQSMWIDGVEIVRDGVVVGPAQVAALEQTLQPVHP